MLAYLGIDPGKSGGAAVISHADRSSAPIVEFAFSFKDKTECEIFDFFDSLPTIDSARLENVSASPQMGVTSAFTFGRGYGFLTGIITALGFSYELVTPQVWQRSMKCMSAGKKIVTRKKAQQLYASQFPLENGPKQITDYIADALLIATYCSRRERGLL